MKTLLVSIYDGVAENTAALIDENGKLQEVKLSKNLYRLIWERNWFDIYSDKYEKQVQNYNKFLSSYDSIVICENGKIEKVK